MLPSLSDLDVEKLSPLARASLAAAQELADGAPIEQVAAGLGVTVDTLRRRLETLAAEWRGQSASSSIPPLTGDDYEALRDSIARYGQLVPVLADVDGNVIDGRARLRACRELDKAPSIQYLPADAPADQLRCLAVAVNVARRHLSATARRGIVRDELLRDATRSDRAIAVAAGVSPTFVGTVRRELQSTGEVSTVDTRVGRDGVAQPATKPQPETPEVPVTTLDVTLRIGSELAAGLDGGAWIDCRAVRLVLVAAGTYVLELRE